MLGVAGGFVEIDESLDDAARRELEEETGVRNIYLEQLCAVGELDRDPRERVITIAYYALIKLSHHKIQAATDAQDVHWFPISKLPKLAFDHASIFQMAIDRLKQKVRHQPIGFELLPNKFKLSQLQHLYEAILERTIDKRNFRRKILAMGILENSRKSKKGSPIELPNSIASTRGAIKSNFNEDFSSKSRRLEREKENVMKVLILVDLQNDFVAPGRYQFPKVTKSSRSPIESLIISMWSSPLKIGTPPITRASLVNIRGYRLEARLS